MIYTRRKTVKGVVKKDSTKEGQQQQQQQLTNVTWPVPLTVRLSFQLDHSQSAPKSEVIRSAQAEAAKSKTNGLREHYRSFALIKTINKTWWTTTD